jgi:hypothetical protein
LAAAIPVSRLLLIEGLGHDLPAWAFERFVPAILEHTAAAAAGTA